MRRFYGIGHWQMKHEACGLVAAALPAFRNRLAANKSEDFDSLIAIFEPWLAHGKAS